MKRNRRTWWVVGKVAGPWLPKSRQAIGNTLLGPLPSLGPLPREMKALKRVSNVQVKPKSSTYFVAKQPDLNVHSNCYFKIGITESSASTAVDHAIQHEIPQLQVALSLRMEDTPYKMEVLGATDGFRSFGHWSPGVRSAYWLPVDMNANRLDSIRADHSIILQHDTARVAAETLSGATYQEDTAGDEAAEQSALLSYFKVIELIANKIGPVEFSERAERESAILQRLLKKMQSNINQRKKISAIRDANTQLDRLGGSYLSLRIKSAVELLDLTPKCQAAAVEFANVRNKRLAHARLHYVQNSGLHDYPPRRIAREMLLAYVDSLISKLKAGKAKPRGERPLGT